APVINATLPESDWPIALLRSFRADPWSRVILSSVRACLEISSLCPNGAKWSTRRSVASTWLDGYRAGYKEGDTMTVSNVNAGPQGVCRSVEVAAPAAELFAIAADPRRHHDLDGSGTVRDNIKVPAEMAVGSKFSTSMKMYGMPYRITSTVTAFKPNELIE